MDHVWPKWLRQYPAYAGMGAGYTGQRFERVERVLVQGEDERYREVPEPSLSVTSPRSFRTSRSGCAAHVIPAG
jgi:hypothetical protein